MYKLALGTKTSNSKCAFDYKVDVNKSKFVMQQDKWEQVKESSEPAGGIVTLTTGDIERTLNTTEGWQRNVNAILKTDTGFLLVTKSACSDAQETADKLRDSVERAYVVKFNSGDYNEKNVQSFATDEK